MLCGKWKCVKVTFTSAEICRKNLDANNISEFYKYPIQTTEVYFINKLNGSYLECGTGYDSKPFSMYRFANTITDLCQLKRREDAMGEHVQNSIRPRGPAAPVYGREGGSRDNHFLSGQSGRLSAAPAHGSLSSSPWLNELQHAIMLCSCVSLGFPTPRGVVEESNGTEKRQDGRKEERRRKRGRIERRDMAWALGARQVTLPFLSSVYPFSPAPPWLPLSTQWTLLCWNFTLLDPGLGVLSSYNVQAAEHAARETHSAS